MADYEVNKLECKVLCGGELCCFDDSFVIGNDLII